MRLCYPSVGSKPILLVLVEDVATGFRSVFPMLVDTGADETCFPAWQFTLIPTPKRKDSKWDISIRT